MKTALRVGAVGHIAMTDATHSLVRQVLRHELGVLSEDGRQPLRGVSGAAAGTDQMFVQAMALLRFPYSLAIASRDYRLLMRDDLQRSTYDFCVNGTNVVQVLPYARGCREAYAEAAMCVLRASDHLLAVRDGQPDNGPGSTAWTVAMARRAGIPITVCWPTGAPRLREKRNS